MRERAQSVVSNLEFTAGFGRKNTKDVKST